MNGAEIDFIKPHLIDKAGGKFTAAGPPKRRSDTAKKKKIANTNWL